MKSFCIAIAIWSCLTLRGAWAQTDVAVTVDDLPTHGARGKNTTRLEIADRMIGALREHRVPAAYGFVNGGQIHDAPEHSAILRAWLAAGFPLGNHTLSHLDLGTVSAAEYIADIQENERFLSQFRPAGPAKVFRYPYLAEGESPDKRNTVRAWLAADGYRIAQVTVYFDDWAWNDPYVRCQAQGDVTAIARLKRSFTETALGGLAWAREVAHALFQRPIPQVLLLHIGEFSSLMTDDLLAAYAQAGVRFIPLEMALRDAVYDINPEVVWTGELSFLAQLIRAKRLAVPPAPEIPFRQMDSLCR